MLTSYSCNSIGALVGCMFSVQISQSRVRRVTLCILDKAKVLAPLRQQRLKDRYQWWGHEFRHSLSLDMDKLFPKAILCVLYH